MAGEYVPSYYYTPSYGGGFFQGTPIMYPINGNMAYIPYFVVYDPNLKPQNTKSYELGADLTFLEWFSFIELYVFSSERERPNLRGAFGWLHRCFQYDDEWWKDALKRT